MGQKLADGSGSVRDGIYDNGNSQSTSTAIDGFELTLDTGQYGTVEDVVFSLVQNLFIHPTVWPWEGDDRR